MAETYRLRIYADDGTTIAAEFSTDPAHARPYMLPPDDLAAQEVDFQKGSATIGGCTVELVDVPTNPADQDTGFVTALLADSIGRLAHLQVLIGAGYENVLNGVVADIELHESYSSFTISLHDQREIERQITAFGRATTASVFPRGVIAGFGYNAETELWAIPPTEPVTALYHEFTPNVLVGMLLFPHRADRVPAWQVVAPKAEAALTSIGDVIEGDTYESDPDGITPWRYDRIRLLWREVGATIFNVVENMGAGTAPTISGGTYKDAAGHVWDVQYLKTFSFIWPLGAVRPAVNDTDIEVIIGYDGPPSEDYPLHIEGTFGSVLKDLYDGDYSSGTPTAIQYDSTAVLALTEPFRARITEALEDQDGIWAWTEENIFSVLGAAPALDSDGFISPVRDTLPDPDDVLLELDDTNCEPAPGWNHTGDDAVNSVSVTYTRVWHTAIEEDPNSEKSAGDGLSSREVTVTHRYPASIAIPGIGEKKLELRSVGLVAIGGAIPYALGNGDTDSEVGGQLALARAHAAIDRYLYGGQHYALTVMRSALGTTRVGDWCIVACSWMPDYDTQQRGANRLAQIVSIQPLDSAWSEVALIDAGPPTERLAQPEICGTPTVNADGSITVPVCLTDTDLWEDILALSPTVLWKNGEASGTSADDATAGNRDGTYIGSPTLGQPGIIPNVEGTSVLFTGSAQYITRAHDVGLNTGEKKIEWTGYPGLTTTTYPNAWAVLSFFEPTADPVMVLAELINQWSAETRDIGANSLLTGRTATSMAANNALSGALLLNQLNVVVVRKTPTTFVPGADNEPPDPDVPPSIFGGALEIWANGVKVYTAAAVMGGVTTPGALQASRGTIVGAARYHQGTAYWADAAANNLTDAAIEAITAKANTAGDFGDDPSSIVLEYAIGDAEPATGSAAWRFAGSRQDSGNLTVPPVPAGATVWLRVTGTAPQHQPSLPTTALSVTAEETPRVRNVRAVVETDGSAVVTWTPNLFALGVTLHWDAHDPEVDPTFATLDKDASLGTHTFAAGTVGPTQQLTVDVEPFDGWTGSAVSGTAGPIVRASGRPDVVYLTEELADALYLPLAGGTLTGPLTLPDGSLAAPSLVMGQAGLGLYRSLTGASAIGFAASGKTTATLHYRTFNGDDNVALYLGTAQAITNLTADVYIATLTVPTYSQTGATSRAINFNIGQTVCRATDTATRTAAFGNVEFDFTQYEQLGGAVIFNKVFNSRFRFSIPKTGVTIVDNIGIDFVIPNAGDVTGAVTNYGAINIPAMTGGGGTNFFGIRFNNTPSMGSITGTSGTAIAINATGDAPVRLQTNGTTTAHTDATGLHLAASRVLTFINTGRNKRLYVDYATSPRDMLAFESIGSSGGWRGGFDFNTSYNNGTLFNAMRLLANTDGITVAASITGALAVSGALTVNDVLTINVAATFGIRLNSSYTNVEFASFANGAAVDNRGWGYLNSGTTWSLRTLNDAYSVGTDALTITRSGNSITGIALGAPISGVLTVTGDVVAPAIRRGTVDGSDDSLFAFYGGGGPGNNRGAAVAVFGNEHGSTGTVYLEAGNVAGGIIRFLTGGADRGQVTYGGVLAWGTTDVTNAVAGDVRLAGALWIGDGVTAPTARAGFVGIYVDTADGDLKAVFGDGTVKLLSIDT